MTATIRHRTASRVRLYATLRCSDHPAVCMYRSYGIHWCLNIVCRAQGHGAGVLIRALEPTHGLDRMRERRVLQDVRLLCAGPGRVGQALGVDASYNGRAVTEPPFALTRDGDPSSLIVERGPRIGISKAADVPWRFGERGSRYLSRPFRRVQEASGGDATGVG